jgi:hypothetical protein
MRRTPTSCRTSPGETEAFRAWYFRAWYYELLLAHQAPICTSPLNWRTCSTPGSGAIRMGSRAAKATSTTSTSSSSWQAFTEPPEIPALGATSLWMHSRTSGTKIRGMHGRNLRLRAFVEGYIVDCPKASPWEYRFLLTMEMLTTIRNLTYSFNFINSVTTGALPTVVPTGPQKSSKQQWLWARMSEP